MLLLQSHSTLCDPMEPPGSSVHRILQARTLEWVAMLSWDAPGDLPDPGIEPAYRAAPVFQVDSLLLSHHGSPLQCNTWP